MKSFVCFVFALMLTVSAGVAQGKEVTLVKSVTNKVLGIAAAAGFTAVLAFSQPAEAVELGTSASYDMHEQDAQLTLHLQHELGGFDVAGKLSFRDLKELGKITELDSYDYGIGLSRGFGRLHKSIPLDVRFDASYDHQEDYRTLVGADLGFGLQALKAEGITVGLEGGVGLLGDEFKDLDKVIFVGLGADVMGFDVDFRRHMDMSSRKRVKDTASVSYDLLDGVGVVASYEHYGRKDKRMLITANFDIEGLIPKAKVAK